jgi:omega-6 fatty acid desaturase (delta-12 desaturase)
MSAELSPRWARRLAHYAEPDNRRAVFELALTLTLYALAWTFACVLIGLSPWLAPLAALPAAGLLLRVFVIQHDCGHQAMFASQAMNDWIGRGLGVITLTPYDYWRHAHAQHHASSGNLDKRGIGDIDTLTVSEYRARTRLGRLAYRAYRHPLVLFLIGPAYIFILQHRAPLMAMRYGHVPWVNILATNAGMAALYGALIWLVGWQTFLLVQLPVALYGASAGVWLFYVQHQFDPTYWERAPKWEREKAALEGSSFYDLPGPLMWLTGNIGIHQVHHLSSRIPFYRLPQVIADHPELAGDNRLTFWASLKCVRLTLWCEDTKRLISFGDAVRMAA